jgi:hypothetical protein
MPLSSLTLICFAVKEEAAPFKASVASRPDIQILLTGMGQRNAEKSIRTALHLRTAAVSETRRRNVTSLDAPAPQEATPSTRESTTPSLHHSTTPSLVLTCGFAGALNPDLSFGTVLFSCDDAPHLQARLLAASAHPALFHCANRVASTATEKHALWQSTHADAVEMESQIIANISREHEIPCATIRVILDIASEDLPLDFNFLMTADQQMDYRKLAFSLAKSPSKIAALLRLQKQSQAAARRLANCLEKLIC